MSLGGGAKRVSSPLARMSETGGSITPIRSNIHRNRRMNVNNFGFKVGSLGNFNEFTRKAGIMAKIISENMINSTKFVVPNKLYEYITSSKVLALMLNAHTKVNMRIAQTVNREINCFVEPKRRASL